MAWPAGCDPFWSELNAGCSDEFGNYKTPPGGAVVSVDVMGGTRNPVLPNIVTRGDAPIATQARPIVAGLSNTSLFLMATGVLALVVLKKG